MSVTTRPRGGTTASVPRRTAPGRPAGPHARSRARFAARAAAARRRPRLVAFAAVVLVACGLALAWVVWFTPAMSAREVRVVGGDAELRAAVVRAAQISRETPLAALDTTAVARRVVRVPAVAEVTVRRLYPSAVVIDITPRTPALALRVKGQPSVEIQIVDKKGVVFATAVRAPRQLPVVLVDSVVPDQDQLRRAVSVLGDLPATLRQQVDTVEISSTGLVVLQVAQGGRSRTVVWGDEQEPDLKAAVASLLLDKPGVKVVDVSAPRSPVTR